MFKRFVCWLIGHRLCEPTCGVELCERCGASHDYMETGGPFTDRERFGVFDPLWQVFSRLRRWTWPRCDQCGKLLVFRRKYGETFCSEECMRDWLPF